MAVTGSGQIKLSDLAAEWGDPAPYNLSHYYVGGTAGVSDTITESTVIPNGQTSGSFGNRGGRYQGNQSNLNINGGFDGNFGQNFSRNMTFSAPVSWNINGNGNPNSGGPVSFGGTTIFSPPGSFTPGSKPSGNYNISSVHFNNPAMGFTISWNTTGTIIYDSGNPVTTNQVVDVNNNVPSSGQLKLSNFYGGRAS